MTHFKFNTHVVFLASGLLAVPALLQAQIPEAQSPTEQAEEAEQLPPDAAAPPSQTEPAQPAEPTAQVEEAKVDQFADAYVAVQAIQAQAAQQLSATKEADKAIEVKANAEKEMVRAVERSGLEVEEFNRIADLMATDLTLRTKVIDKVQKRSKG